MAQVPATSYESTSLGDVAEFTIPFPFLSRAEVFVTVDGAPVAFTWINDGLVQLAEVPELGAIVRRYRSTEAYVPLHQFSQGVPFLPRYVDRDFKQTLYAVQESVNDTAGTAALALGTAELALDTAQAALALVGERTQYMVLGPYGPGLHFQTTSQVFSYLGEFYAPGPAITLPYTTTGVGAAEIANFRSVGDAVLRSDLEDDADPLKGAGMVGYRDSTVHAALDMTGKFERPEAYGYSASLSLSARTAAVQAAFDAANTNKTTLLLGDFYRVDRVLLVGHTEYSIIGTGALIGEAIVPRSAVLEMKNCRGIKSYGQITISGNNSLNYAAATKVWADIPGGSSLLDLNFNQVSAPAGWLFGDMTQPDRLLSEITIRGGYTYQTPQPLVCIGTQCVIEAIGYQLIAEASGPFSAATPVVATAIGSAIHINGGECILASSTTGRAFISRPIDSPGFDNAYGRITATGAQIESASLIFLAYNPDAVSGVAPGTGGLRLSSCSGYHNFLGVSFQGVADFSGRVVVDKTCDFYAPVLRTTYTAAMDGAAVINMEPGAFFNFKAGLGAFLGGIIEFPHQEIFHASNLAGATSAIYTSLALKFTSVPGARNNLRFSTCYNPNTGIFTVPAGGLKNISLFTQFDCIAARPTSDITVPEAGYFPGGIFGVPHRYVSATTFIGDLPAGAQITLSIRNSDATFKFASVPYDRISISASC